MIPTLYCGFPECLCKPNLSYFEHPLLSQTNSEAPSEKGGGGKWDAGEQRSGLPVPAFSVKTNSNIASVIALPRKTFPTPPPSSTWTNPFPKSNHQTQTKCCTVPGISNQLILSLTLGSSAKKHLTHQRRRTNR